MEEQKKTGILSQLYHEVAGNEASKKTNKGDDKIWALTIISTEMNGALDESHHLVLKGLEDFEYDLMIYEEPCTVMKLEAKDESWYH